MVRKKPTCSTPGSARPSGRTRRSAGPSNTPELDYYYPTSTLITSRDIITLWVARMVLTGLNNVGEVPFREVFIHPKILDGYGETMSKSKGNGVDPLDVIDKFGADALRFGLAYLTTETQDVRMPVQFECPHCQASIEQTKKNRVLPRVECPSCKKPFSTQWAREPADCVAAWTGIERTVRGCPQLRQQALECFAIFTDEPGRLPITPVDDAQLFLEDRWILSRLSTVTGMVTEELELYRFAEASRVLYDFAWDDFCSFYLEILKSRMNDDHPRNRSNAFSVHTRSIIAVAASDYALCN